MNVKTKGSSVTITADEGMWITAWTEVQDIVAFAAYKQIVTTRSQKNNWREISDDEKKLLEERRDVALAAADVEASGDGE